MPTPSHLLEAVGLAARRCLQNGIDSAYPDLSAGLEYLLSWHWADAEIHPARTFDGLGAATIFEQSADDLTLVGLMFDINTQEMEWFSAQLSLQTGTERLRSYRLCFGVDGMPPVPVGVSAKYFAKGLTEIPTMQWTRVFTGPGP